MRLVALQLRARVVDRRAADEAAREELLLPLEVRRRQVARRARLLQLLGRPSRLRAGACRSAGSASRASRARAAARRPRAAPRSRSRARARTAARPRRPARRAAPQAAAASPRTAPPRAGTRLRCSPSAARSPAGRARRQRERGGGSPIPARRATREFDPPSRPRSLPFALWPIWESGEGARVARYNPERALTMSPPAAAPLSIHRFAFTGRTRDYFRIWAVSLCLSLLTLGVYSAWGKVRKRRYLYRAHAARWLRLRVSRRAARDSEGPRDRARALRRLRALRPFPARECRSRSSLLLLLLTPWIVVASSRFNARNSAYRNVAFAFDGTFREAAKVHAGLRRDRASSRPASATRGSGCAARASSSSGIASARRRSRPTSPSSGFIVAYLLAGADADRRGVVLMFAAIGAAFMIAGGA